MSKRIDFFDGVESSSTPTISSSELPNSGVTAGSYTNASITVTAKGIITSASSGSAGATSSAVVLEAVYDFSVLGGTQGDYILRNKLGANAVIPANAMVTDCAAYIDSDFTSSTNVASVYTGFGDPNNGNVFTPQDTISAAGWTSSDHFTTTYQADGDGVTGRSSFFYKSTSQENVTMRIADEDLTSGKITLRITYLVA